jgi:hypothetical protein
MSKTRKVFDMECMHLRKNMVCVQADAFHVFAHLQAMPAIGFGVARISFWAMV